MPFHSKHSVWRTLWNQVGCRRWYYRARSHQPNPSQSLQLQQSSNLHRRQSKLQSVYMEGQNQYSLKPIEMIKKWNGGSWAHQLCNHKCHYEQYTRALHIGPASWSCNKYEGLTDSAHLQINCWGKLPNVIMSCFLKSRNPKYSLKISRQEI